MTKDQVVLDKQDLTYLAWTKIRNSSGTAGSFLKAFSDLEGKKIYYNLSNYDAFRGIIGHECLNIDNDTLYESGDAVSLTMEDFSRFISYRVANTAEAAELLDCSRQNVEDLVRRGKLHPVKTDAKNKIFLRSEILQRLWR